MNIVSGTLKRTFGRVVRAVWEYSPAPRGSAGMHPARLLHELVRLLQLLRHRLIRSGRPLLCASEKAAIQVAFRTVQELEKKMGPVFADHVAAVARSTVSSRAYEFQRIAVPLPGRPGRRRVATTLFQTVKGGISYALRNGQIAPWWLRGIPADLWLQHGHIVESFIKEQKLKPVDPKFLVTKLEVLAGSPRQSLQPRQPQKPVESNRHPGGIRIAHLHFRNDVYLLDAAQWKAFSGKVLEQFSAKLSKASTVSFDQLLDLSDAVDSIAG